MDNDNDTLRSEYPEDLIKSGIRGKYAKQYREGTNIALIKPDKTIKELSGDKEAGK